MSANLEKSKLPLKAVLKPTGFYPPKSVENMTLDQAIASDNPELETNNAVTIDVSKYTGAVEFVPSEGYNAMKKITITLINIPEPAPAEEPKE